MRRAFPYLLAALGLWASTATAQALEPRSYSPSPIGASFVVVGYGNSSGSVLFDAGAPISDAHATINSATLGYSRVIDLAGRQSSLTVAAPYLWGQASGNLGETASAITRSGLGDLRMKLSTLLVGGPALSREQFAARRPKPVVGFSLLAIAPTGEYRADKLVNLGAHRWAVKPEIGASFPFGRWQADVYAGVWLYGDNPDYLNGVGQTRAPMGAFQAHLSYTIRRGFWAAVDTTYYAGGETTVGGVRQINRAKNARVGLTLSAPVTPRQSLQLHYGKGALTRVGGDFESFSINWRMLWFD